MPYPKPAKDLPTVRLFVIAAVIAIWIAFCVGTTFGYVVGRMV